MNALDAAITVCLQVLLVLMAVGVQSLQASLEHWDYDRHFDDQLYNQSWTAAKYFGDGLRRGANHAR